MDHVMCNPCSQVYHVLVYHRGGGGEQWIGQDRISFFTQGKPLANVHYTRLPANSTNKGGGGEEKRKVSKLNEKLT